MVFAYDIGYGSAYDLLQPMVFEKLIAFIKRHAHEIALIWMGTPCTTWSRARKNDGGPPPLRDDAGLWGLPGLSKHDLAKVADGNALLLCSVQIAELRAQLQIPWVLENLASSRIWLTRSLRTLLAEGAQFLTSAVLALHGANQLA